MNLREQRRADIIAYCSEPRTAPDIVKHFNMASSSRATTILMRLVNNGSLLRQYSVDYKLYYYCSNEFVLDGKKVKRKIKAPPQPTVLLHYLRNRAEEMKTPAGRAFHRFLYGVK